MKKLFFAECVLFLCFFCFAKQKTPEWILNYRTVFPESEFIAQPGIGDSVEFARNDAAAALSGYFKTNVNANLSTSTTAVSLNGKSFETTVLVDDVKVKSQVDFYGLEYTEPFFYKSDKKWHCIAYLNRRNAWKQIKPELEIKKNSFNGLYKNLEKETDFFTKASLCRKTFEAGNDLLESLEFARIISPENEAGYKNERNEISTVPVIYEEAMKNLSIYVQVNSDYERNLERALSKGLTAAGFKVEKSETSADYIAEVEADDNVSGSEPLSVMPEVNLKIINPAGKSVFSCEICAEKKSLGYTLETAQKKAYPPLAEKLEAEVKNGLSAVLKLK